MIIIGTAKIRLLTALYSATRCSCLAGRSPQADARIRLARTLCALTQATASIGSAIRGAGIIILDRRAHRILLNGSELFSTSASASQ